MKKNYNIHYVWIEQDQNSCNKCFHWKKRINFVKIVKIDCFLQFLPTILNALFWFCYSMIGWKISEPNATTEWRNIGWLGYYEQLNSLIEVDPVYGIKLTAYCFFVNFTADNIFVFNFKLLIFTKLNTWE